jgi:GalNAc-alpha-(1->4)-GalNAc-alpha-(1->3)-diNAcBac-PP-undecaprenol alpha-1,4-N-acetyl-D-galactosaminyltransferase
MKACEKEVRTVSLRASLVVNSLVQGGAQKSVIMLATELKNIGFEVQILTFYPEESDFFQVPSGIKLKRFIHPFHDRKRIKPRHKFITKIARIKFRINDLLEIRTVIKDFQPDVVISFETATSIISFLATIKMCPILVSERVHPEHHEIETWAKLLRPIVYRSTRVFLHCQGELIAKSMKETYKKDITVIPNFIDEPTSSLWNPNSNKIKVFSRYSQQKGIDLAIESWNLLPAKLKESYILEVFGDGDKTNYEKLVDKYDLKGKVKLNGPTKSTKKELEDCLIFLLPSRYEGFPNSLAEAMNCGIPSIATDCPSAIRDLTVQGTIVELSAIDAHSISTKLTELLTNESLRVELSRKSSEIQNYFRNDDTLLKWLDFINGIVKNSRPTL